MSFTLLNYFWQDRRGKLYSKTVVHNKVINHVQEVSKQNLDYVVNTDGRKGTQTILLHPIRLYNNPFKPMKNSFLVLCDAQFDDRDMDRQLFQQEIPFSAAQQFYLLDCEKKPVNDRNISKEDYKLALREVICLDENICPEILQFSKNLEKLLLICGVRLNEINYSKLSQFEVIISEEGSKLGDDILTLRYIASKLANEMGLFVNYSNNIGFENLEKTRCVFDFYTDKMSQDGGINEINRIINKMKENHNLYVMNCCFTDEEVPDFSHSVGHYENNVRIPIQTFVNKKGNLQDYRPLSNCNPYKYINYLFDILGIERKEFFNYDNVMSELKKESENDEEIKKFFETQLVNYKNEIRMALQSLYKNIDPSDRDEVMDKVKALQNKYSPEINKNLMNRDLETARNLMNELVKQIVKCDVAKEINLDEDLQNEVI